VTNESKTTFFKQSGWMVIATSMSGAFLVGVYPLLGKLPSTEVAIYVSLLRLFTLLGIGAAGLQIVMAQDAAAAITDELKLRLAATVRSVATAVFGLWLLMLLICVPLRQEIVSTFKITNPIAVWVTMGLVLMQLLLPFMQGLLQGMQNFAWLGWSIMLNGLARFIAIAIAVILLKGHSAAALTGALFGMAAAVFAGYWPSRHLFNLRGGTFRWLDWLKRLVPLSAGVGAVLVVMNADMLFIQAQFPSEQSKFYAAVAMVGVGLVTFTTPMASVMFPKLVTSVAKGQRSNSFMLALAGTALLGIFGAVVCTVLPELPLRILFFNKPEFWISSQLIPWFMWCMLPVTVANVMVSDLLAKRRFAVVPFLVLIAFAYCWTIHQFLAHVPTEDHFAAFKGVIQRLGVFASLLLIAAAAFSFITHYLSDHTANSLPSGSVK
jgi:O-antigen/teichoic acid export membrane protein